MQLNANSMYENNNYMRNISFCILDFYRYDLV